MSNIYHTEPPTQGKALVHTTMGDIDIELWSKEAPLACRNFIQLSLEGYYDGNEVHRVIKDFMVQTGDPTGTGKGGSSIWGRPFKDEIHGRIKFNHRGQVAMANENRPNTNQSQFIITLGECDWLNRKHTIFGKVTGNTVYNLMRMSDVEVDSNDRPLDPILIKSIEILWNPFDDIVPRVINIKSKSDELVSSNNASKKPARKATRDMKLLSFGDGEEEGQDTDTVTKVKIKSFHDSNVKGDRYSEEVDESILSSVVNSSINTNKNLRDDSTSSSKRTDGGSNSNRNKESDFDEAMRLKLIEKKLKIAELNKRNKCSSNEPPKSEETKSNNFISTANENSDNNEDDNWDIDNGKSQQQEALKKKSDEYQQLKKDLLRSRRAVQVATGEDAEKSRQEVATKEMITPLEQRRLKYKKRKMEHGDRQEETLRKLQQFSSSVREAKKQSSSDDKNNDKSKKMYAEVYSGQVMEDGSDEELGDEKGWHLGKLKFRKHIDDLYRMGGDGRAIDDYKVIDPRNK